MVDKIPPTYASPGLRWGLCLEDHPEAFVVFAEVSGRDPLLDIPSSLGGDSMFCVAEVHFPPESKRVNVIGYKAIPDNPVAPRAVAKDEPPHLADLWNLLCTKALGRALKRSGYPDDIPDLRALTVWRMREAQRTVLLDGGASLSMTLADADAAITAAGKVDGAVTGDDGDAPDTTRQLPVGDPPTLQSLDEIRRIVNALGSSSSGLRNWCKEQGFRFTQPSSEDEAQKIISEGRLRVVALAEAESPDGAGEPPSGPRGVIEASDAAPVDPSEGAAPSEPEEVATIKELLEGLDAAGKKAWGAYARTVKIDTKVDPSEWSAESRAEAMAWLEVG